MKNLQKPQKPAFSLKKHAKTLFFNLQRDYEIKDPDGLTTLSLGCLQFQRVLEARAIVAKEGAVIEDRFHQKKEHPAVAIERSATDAMLRAFKQLGLDCEPLRDKPGRPPGR
jgi:phage terminase small subunit